MQNFDIQGSAYGVWKSVGKNDKQFVPFGKRPRVIDVFESLEDDSVTLKLATSFFGRCKIAYVDCTDLVGSKAACVLAEKGFDVTNGKVNYFLESIRRGMDWLENDRTPVTPSYSNVGWIRLSAEVSDDQESDDDPDTAKSVPMLFYRSHKLVGSEEYARYLGDLALEPSGDYEQWKAMVEKDVIPYPAMQFGLIASLSAVPVGALSYITPLENPVIHFWLKSGAGKTALLYCCCSCYGKPFEGTMVDTDEDGRIVEKRSVLGSWGCTDAYMTASLAGNRGVATILNELGKNISKHMDSLLFAAAEGSDRQRLDTSLQARVSPGYATTILSSGEGSLLDQCSNRLEGLATRVMEITDPLTKDAAHANRVKRTSSEHYGFAAPMLAEHIMENGGEKYVLDRYDYWCTYLRPKFGDTPNVERFIEKFAALFMATAEMSSRALGIDFDMDGLLAFLKNYDAKHGAGRNTSLASYNLLLEHFKRRERNNFYIRQDKSFVYGAGITRTMNSPKGECWGRITEKSVPQPNGCVLVREYEVYPTVVDSLLKENKFYSTSTCVAAWKAAGLLDTDGDHSTKKRKIGISDADSHHSRVYVFKEYVDGQEATNMRKAIIKKQAQAKKLKKNSNVLNLPQDDADGGDSHA